MLSSSVLEDLLEFLVERLEYFRTRPLSEKLFVPSSYMPITPK
ncbi:MAG: hypothetical protein QXT86_12995 [Archaeoglobaceae archaeon]